MKKQKLRIIIVLITSIVAIIIISLTIGRELYEGKSHSLSSFALIHFSGYLFFLLMPVEMAFIYYLSCQGDAELTIIAVITAVAAQLIDYMIGLWVSSQIIHNLIGVKRIARAEGQIRKFGNLTIFAFNLLPLSSPVISLVAGMIKFRFRHFLLYSMAGLVFKYLLLCLIF